MIHPLFHKVGWIPPKRAKRCATDHVAIELHQLSSRLMSTAHDHVTRFPSAPEIVLGRGGGAAPNRSDLKMSTFTYIYTLCIYTCTGMHTLETYSKCIIVR